ncbi:hypothetical protein SSABA_v1c05300 [Spiroplasma sabaudiense Ar-1343]|uniref:Uncharacterized protein n=1 Tax=Spiroplasma sabaudiense Ar-1343 TaxID=1276257 RepID=W6AA47_9MOLU|nr:hypothetical protein [Spiroplasma sabaudiense]AHI53937.1 hypothetical protein SSABA_v1c05300 [Spiroplasma sabaudiense Ar-1343]
MATNLVLNQSSKNREKQPLSAKNSPRVVKSPKSAKNSHLSPKTEPKTLVIDINDFNNLKLNDFIKTVESDDE